MDTPNSPQELLALQSESQEVSFTQTVEDALDVHEPTPFEALKVSIRMLRSMKEYVFSEIQEADDYLKQEWQEDYDKLNKALDLLKAVDL
jgi:hypothetical protein